MAVGVQFTFGLASFSLLLIISLDFLCPLLPPPFISPPLPPLPFPASFPFLQPIADDKIKTKSMGHISDGCILSSGTKK